MTGEMDVVLVYFEGNPIAFARIEKIAPDSKKNWYQVKMLLLQLPLQSVTWILRQAYIDGEPFTMSGKNMRLEKVICPDDSKAETPAGGRDHAVTSLESAKIISLADLKKKSPV